MRIILSGGGTLGSVSPLIAIYEKLKEQKPNCEFLWVGTKYGPEYKMVKDYNIPFSYILAAKLRRYFSLKNLIDIFIILPLAFIQSFFLLRKYRPELILSAGGFVSVPLVWAAKLVKVKAIIHQQDVRPGLANKLMAPFAEIITLTFESSKKDFPKDKSIVTGNPVRDDMISGSKQQGIEIFHLDKNLPTVLILGGGTGAFKINQLILDSLQELVDFCQVIHSTGGKLNIKAQHSRYHDCDFIGKDLGQAYAAADLVVTRAGLSVLSELSVLKKPTIIIPMPLSHQVDNAIEFAKNNAAIMLDQNKINPKIFVKIVKELLSNKPMLDNMGRNIGKMMSEDAAKKIVDLILSRTY